MPDTAPSGLPKTALTDRIRLLYEGRSRRAQRFRYALVAFDVLVLVYVAASSFVSTEDGLITLLDLVFGVLCLADFLARLSFAPSKLRFTVSPWSIIDLLTIASFVLNPPGHGIAFVRALRTIRILRSYQTLRVLRADWPFFRRNEEVVFAALNMVVFVFIMTGFVYETQLRLNHDIHTYGDALYFTVSTLTTTGYGDITLTGPFGRATSIVLMLTGVTLFLRLAQVLFRPARMHVRCDRCGLDLHEPDALHCRHCGADLEIPPDTRQ